MEVLVYLLLHLAICLIAAVIKLKKGIKDRFPLVFIICVPVFGVVMWLAGGLCLKINGGRRRELELEKLKVTDARYRRMEAAEEEAGASVVPLEEALIVNDTKLRRTLMLDILHKKPEEYLDLLKTASAGSDTEITHYATTTLLEIQSDFEMKIQKSLSECRKHPEKIDELKKYRDILRDYTGSGLLSGSVLKMQQMSLMEALRRLLGEEAPGREDIFLYIETALDAGEYQEAGRTLEEYERVCGREELWYQLLVRYEWETGNGKNIAGHLKRLQDKEIYLTKAGKEWFAFWSKGLEYEI